MSIISDYLGTPTHAYNNKGSLVWERELDIYGTLRKGENSFVPFLYQGQYIDEETGLAYNRHRYYDNESGNYISQDPIGLRGGTKLYSYVMDSNGWIARMQLVTTPDHKATFPHEGAVSQFMKENDLDGKYGTQATKQRAKELNELQNVNAHTSH